MVAQALGEKAALDGFWYSVGHSLNDLLYLVQQNPYLLIGVVIVLGFFLLRKS